MSKQDESRMSIYPAKTIKKKIERLAERSRKSANAIVLDAIDFGLPSVEKAVEVSEKGKAA